MNEAFCICGVICAVSLWFVESRAPNLISHVLFIIAGMSGIAFCTLGFIMYGALRGFLILLGVFLIGGVLAATRSPLATVIAMIYVAKERD